MKTRTLTRTLTLMVVAMALAAGASLAAPAASDGKAAFERLKGLTGTWTSPSGGPQDGPMTVVYEVTGQGSALKETLFPGTPHEMLTVYHMDGTDLVLTHYCAAGNQPHMKLVRTVAGPPYELVFDFAGGTNIDAAKDMHMHSAHLRLLAPDRLETEWTSYQAGKATDTKKLVVSRKK